jgi:hydroxymethylpyrimidine pyrophosphatase-like HAD family hydrolase
MGNSIEEVLKVADAMADMSDNGSVAKYIVDYIL